MMSIKLGESLFSVNLTIVRPCMCVCVCAMASVKVYRKQPKQSKGPMKYSKRTKTLLRIHRVQEDDANSIVLKTFTLPFAK